MAVKTWKNVLLVSIAFFLNLNIAVGRPVRMTCPSGCTCRSSFQLVKCTDRDNVPTGSFSRKVKELDLRSAQITVIKKGSMIKYSNLKRLSLAGNPFDCTSKNLRKTQRELFQLLKREELSRFDGKSLRCATPRRLKGKRILFLAMSTPNTSGAFSLDRAFRHNIERVHSSSSVVGAAVSIAFAFVFILLLFVVLFLHKDRVFKFILERMTDVRQRRKRRKDSAQSILNHSLSKDAKPSQQVNYVQLPTTDKHVAFPDKLDWIGYNQQQQATDNLSDLYITTPTSEFTSYMKEKMAKVRRESKGYPEGDESSDEEAWTDISLK